MAFDLKITGGTIVDGTGKPGYAGDIGIKDGKVVALGKAEGPAAATIDAAGRIVAPGFVDVHTHYDAQVLWDRMLSISPWHGVTTTVIGNCGFGVAPTRAAHRKLIMQTLEKVEGMSLEALEAGLGTAWPFETFPQYLDALEKQGSAINIAALFGHTPLRLYVMGEESTERAATPDEIARMKTLVREAMDAGAIGFGTSVSVSHNGYAGKPVPSRQATVEEMDALVSVMGELKRGLMQITIGRDFSTRHMAEVSRKYQIPVLDRMKQQGYIVDYRIYHPQFHTDEASRWDYRVEITYRDQEAGSHEEEVAQQVGGIGDEQDHVGCPLPGDLAGERVGHDLLVRRRGGGFPQVFQMQLHVPAHLFDQSQLKPGARILGRQFQRLP